MSYGGSAYGQAPYGGSGTAAVADVTVEHVAEVPGVASSTNIEVVVTVDHTASVPGVVSDVAIDVEEAFVSVTHGSTLPAIVSDTNLAVLVGVVHDSTVPGVVSDVAVAVVATITHDALVPGVVSDVSIGTDTAVEVTHDASVAAVVSTVTVTTAPWGNTDTDYLEGRQRGGIGYVQYDPPLAPVTAVYGASEVYAQARGPVAIVGTEAVFETVEARLPALRKQIIVGNKDVTEWRGIPTPGIPFQLVEPFCYNAGTMTLPQAIAWAEEAGVGDLDWFDVDKPVKIRAIDPSDDSVVAVLYKGWVKSLDPSGDIYTAQLDGEILGRATDAYRPQPVFRKKDDIGLLLMRAIRRLGGRTASRLGPTTKILQYRTGGSHFAQYLISLLALAQDRRGRQWTVMPDDAGEYAMFRKDTETIDFTVYFTDNNGPVPYDMRRDLGVETNQVYATALSPEGERIMFAVFPGFMQTDPPPFPHAGPFGEGTTNEDTTSGDGITVLIRRLANFNFLTLDELPGGYDEDVTEAVKRVQRKAHLLPTGDVDAATWRALFDLDVTGKNLRFARIEPAAAMSFTQRYLLSANGAIIGLNPDWDPMRRVVAESIDFGASFRRDVVQDWSEDELNDEDEPNWVGSFTVRSGAVIRGLHTPGDPLTSDDIMHAELIRPGMNAWLAQFQGDGMKARVGIVDVDKEGVVTCRVDTRNRDAMKLADIIRRNQEVRVNPAGRWWRDFKSGGMKQALGEFSEGAGYLDEGVDLAGNRWTVLPLIAGDSGTVRTIEFDTHPAAESAVALFGELTPPEVLERLIGDPLTEAGTAKWSDNDILRRLRQNHGLLYQAGDYEYPGGYGAARKGSAILTGEFMEHAGTPYYTRRLPLLYLAVWVDRDTRIRAGRPLLANMEPV